MKLNDALDCVYFTSDFHLGHANILKYCDRPFGTIGEHDKIIIQNFNDIVETYDVVYHLGDFTLGTTQWANNYIRRLKGKWVFLPGSHDKWLKGLPPFAVPSLTGQFPSVEDPLVTLEYPAGNKEQVVIILCHYAMRVWDRSHYGSYHLYGHSHGKLPEWGWSMDVGVDAQNFRPVSLRTVLETLEKEKSERN